MSNVEQCGIRYTSGEQCQERATGYMMASDTDGNLYPLPTCAVHDPLAMRQRKLERLAAQDLSRLLTELIEGGATFNSAIALCETMLNRAYWGGGQDTGEVTIYV